MTWISIHYKLIHIFHPKSKVKMIPALTIDGSLYSLIPDHYFTCCFGDYDIIETGGEIVVYETMMWTSLDRYKEQPSEF